MQSSITALGRGLRPQQAAVEHRPASRGSARQQGGRSAVRAYQLGGGGGGGRLSSPADQDVIALARKRMAAGPGGAVVETGNPVVDFVAKFKAAWRIFFPEQQKAMSPKEEGKKRLRMILVADRCGMSPDSISGMRESIVRAVSAYVDIEAEEAVEVNLSMDPELGTIYSVAVPVRRAKAGARAPFGREESDAAAPQYDPNDFNSDPSDQFPWGT